jgi:lipoprotein-releasing system ATP-binding protein
MGPSGCGKSTLLYLLGGLDNPTSGRVLLDGKDYANMKEKEKSRMRRTELGFVFQFHFLLPEFSSRENVAMPLLIHGGVSAIEAMKRADDMLARVGLGDKVQARPGEMSGGQMQRVAIARALINQPRIIFCDEPTGSLDTQSSEQVYHLLRELNSEFHQTIIVVTHEANFAERSDRVITIVDGRVEQDERRKSGE